MNEYLTEGRYCIYKYIIEKVLACNANRGWVGGFFPPLVLCRRFQRPKTRTHTRRIHSTQHTHSRELETHTHKHTDTATRTAVQDIQYCSTFVFFLFARSHAKVTGVGWGGWEGGERLFVRYLRSVTSSRTHHRAATPTAAKKRKKEKPR